MLVSSPTELENQNWFPDALSVLSNAILNSYTDYWLYT